MESSFRHPLMSIHHFLAIIYQPPDWILWANHLLPRATRRQHSDLASYCAYAFCLQREMVIAAMLDQSSEPRPSLCKMVAHFLVSIETT